MALKFDFNKLRTAVAGFLTGVDAKDGSALTGVDEALFVPKIQTAAVTKVVSADTTLTAADFGKVILMGANGVDITLPSCANEAGATLEIILTADYDTAVCTVVQAAATQDFFGNHYDSTAGTSGDSGAAANTKITFSSASVKGDRVELLSDGSVWYVKAFGKADGAITFDN